MRNFRQRWQITFSFLLPALACLTGCESGGHFTIFDYSTRPPIDESIRTVYVPMAQNTTYLRGVEKDLTLAVIRELNTSGFRVTSDCARADTQLDLKIVNNRKATVLFNQLGEVRDAELGVNIEVVWRDMRPGHLGDILSNPKRFDPQELPLPGEPKAVAPTAIPLLITPTANYVPELGGSNLSAHQQIVNRAARQVVNMMEVWR